MNDITYVSTSIAEDNGIRALVDVAVVARGTDYRVIGGHMVQLLALRYPTPNAHPRGTTDADAGLGNPQVTGPAIRRRLLELGYEAQHGNSYVLGAQAIDLLVTGDSSGEPVEVENRSYDVAPGLLLAINTAPMVVAVAALTTTGEEFACDVQIPPVECALILKALVFRVRHEAKDLVDVQTLLEIVMEHRSALDWRMSEPDLRGARLDAARELYALLPMLDRGTGISSAVDVDADRLAALIIYLVRNPATA